MLNKREIFLKKEAMNEYVIKKGVGVTNGREGETTPSFIALI